MTTSRLDYPLLVRQALLGVVRQALQGVAEEGMPSEHHMYLLFRTDHPGTEVPTYLRDAYPEQMQIVLQHQFWGLTVDEDGFSVMLSFSGKKETLVVPFDALLTFADPEANFALQFVVEGEPTDPPEDEGSDEDGTAEGREAEVVDFETFRRR